MRLLLMILLVSAAPALSQTCNAGQTLLKNDNLPAVPPPGPTTVSVIQGLCEGEACGAVFNFASVGPSIKVNLASVAYINVGGASGIQAAVDLEFFDGITFSGPNQSVANLGPSLFRWSTVTGSSIGLVSSGINASPDLSQFNIVATSGNLVCAWWMDLNPQGGTCPTGYQTNYATDYTGGGGFTCSPTVTPPQKNLIYIQGQGWRDASKATVSGFPLCPIYYAGNWIMRVCVEPTAPPAIITYFGPPNPPMGLPVSLGFSSPSDPGGSYVCGISAGTMPGIPFPPIGTIPLNDDVVLQYMLPDILEQPGAAQDWAINFTGLLNASGTAFGTFVIPPVTGVTVYFAFVVLSPPGRISNAVSLSF
jgi:hypothetical protein